MQSYSTDAAITAEVEKKLHDHSRIRSAEINVRVSNSAVCLEGSVADKEEKLAAENAARSVPGVLEVQNRLEIRKLPAAGSMQGSATPANQDPKRRTDKPTEKNNTPSGTSTSIAYEQAKSRQQQQSGS